MSAQAKPDKPRPDREGWAWLLNSRKYHFFTSTENKSLCGKFMLFALPSKLGPDDGINSKEDCAACRRALNQRAAAPEKTS